jgi:hypothetical protein
MISRVVLTSFTRTASLAVALLTMTAGALLAQTSTGSIRGYVRGPGSTPMAGAIVTARHTEMNTTRGTNSNDAGFYNLPGLRPGSYELSVRRLGAAPQTRTIRVLIGQTLDIDFELAETAVTLTGVEVTADLVRRETRTSEVASNVTQEQIEELPSRDRNFLDLTKLAPGVNQAPVNNTDKKFSAGAQPADFVNVFVDGASYKNDVLQGGVAGQDVSRGNPFPQGAVQEFRVITQNFKAEYQKAASAIITATTKSGGNSWEGDGFFNTIGRGGKFSARDPISVRDNRPRPDFSRIQGGGSIGGPIQRDRMFFFGTYELNFQNSPGDVFVGGDAALAPPGLNPQQYAGRFTQEFRQHLGFGKVTFTPSDRNTFDVSGTIRHESDIRGFGGQTSFESAENIQQQIYTGLANWRYSGDRWLNEAQISGQHYRWNPTPLDDQVIGRNYFGIIRIGGRDTEQRFTQNRISLRNDVTRSAVQLAGDHVFKAGVSVDFLTYEATKFFTGNPVFNFRSDEQYLRPFEAFFGFGQPTQDAKNTQIGAYIQDDWSIGERFVLNLGLRWDVETNMVNNDYVTPTQIRDSLSNFYRDSLYVTVPRQNQPFQIVRTVDQLGGLGRYFTDGDDRPAYKKAFQPRLGASFDLFGDGRTVLFGGFGVYYDRNYWNQMFDEEFRRDFKVLQIRFDTIGPRPACTFCVRWDPRYFNKDELAALAASGQAGVPEVFLIANDTKPPKTNQFSLGMRQMFGNTLLSLTYAAARSYNGFAFIRGTRCDSITCNALNPTYARLLISDDRVKTWYDAILLGLDKPLRIDSRWGGGLSYTWAFNNDRQGNFFFALDPRYPTVADFPRRRAPDTQEHTIVANGIARIPWGFLFSSVVTLGTGFTQQAANQTLGTSPQFEQQYIFEPPTRPFLGMGHVFATQNMDLRLAKDFALASGQSVGLALDLFNAFNSRNFGCYDARIPRTGQTNSAFGRPSCSAPGRRFQVGLTYDFGPSIVGTGGR